MRTVLCFVIGVSASINLACGEDPTQAPEETKQMKLLARVDMDAVTAVEFYEAIPGVIIISQVGLLGTKPHVSEEQIHWQDPGTLLRQLLPEGEVVPAAFQAALKRREELLSSDHSQRPASPPTQGHDGIASRKQAIQHKNTGYTTASWFRDFYCSSDGRYEWAWSVENYPWPDTWERFDVDQAFMAAGAVQHNLKWTVKYRTWWSWTSVGSWVLSPGTYRKVDLADWVWDFDIQASVGKDCSGVDLYCLMFSPNPVYHHCGKGGFS